MDDPSAIHDLDNPAAASARQIFRDSARVLALAYRDLDEHCAACTDPAVLTDAYYADLAAVVHRHIHPGRKDPAHV